MKADPIRLPDLILEQYALGELKGSELERVEALLASDPSLRGRLDELRGSNEEILEAYPPAEIAAAVRRRMLAPSGRAAGPGSGAPRRRLRPGAAFAFPAAAAVLVLFGAVLGRGLLFPPRGDEVRAKSGVPGLLIYKKAPSGALALPDGAQAAKGDLLQIKYAAGSESFGAIVSLDGRGAVTWHLPHLGAGKPVEDSSPARIRAPRIEAGGAALDSAYELDDAPAFERFFILSSKESFDLSIVAAALGDLARSGRADTGSPNLPAGIEYKSLLLRKAVR